MLPRSPVPIRQTFRPITSRLALDPVYGGPSFRGRRPGSRWSFAYELPPLRHGKIMNWTGLDAEEDTCVMPIYQPGLDDLPEGAPRVDGAAQSGSALILKGLTPQLWMPPGNFISVITSGQRYCYRIADYAVADESGTVSLPLTAMLRIQHNDGDVVEIMSPKIEGYVTAPDDLWSMGGDQLYHLRFELTEIE